MENSSKTKVKTSYFVRLLVCGDRIRQSGENGVANWSGRNGSTDVKLGRGHHFVPRQNNRSASAN
jgi:hypothetical protein